MGLQPLLPIAGLFSSFWVKVETHFGFVLIFIFSLVFFVEMAERIR